MKDYKKTASSRAAVPKGKTVAKFAAGGGVAATSGSTEQPKISLRQAFRDYYKSNAGRRQMGAGMIGPGFMVHLMGLMKSGRLTK